MTQHTSRLCKGYLTTKESDDQMTWSPQSPDLNPIEIVWDELDLRSEGKAANKCSAYVGRLLEKHSSCWLRECQEKSVQSIIKAKGGYF
jgi:hypothetical protein